MNKRCTYGNAIYYSALKILNRGIWHRDVKEYLLKEVILNCSENNEELWKWRVESSRVILASWNCWATIFYFYSETTYRTWEYLLEVLNLFFFFWQAVESYRLCLKKMFWSTMKTNTKYNIIQAIKYNM